MYPPAMNFSLLDWSAIVLYLGITLALGLYFRSRSGKSVDDYFVSGRNVSWWLAGTSMVATTFAADTPLVVTGLVYTQGIAGNWLWWAFLLSGMMTVFLFARLWRRSGLLTDVQFAEMRYSGKPAAFSARVSRDLSRTASKLTARILDFWPVLCDGSTQDRPCRNASPCWDTSPALTGHTA